VNYAVRMVAVSITSGLLVGAVIAVGAGGVSWAMMAELRKVIRAKEAAATTDRT
jgi:hypothetical protein